MLISFREGKCSNSVSIISLSEYMLFYGFQLTGRGRITIVLRENRLKGNDPVDYETWVSVTGRIWTIWPKGHQNKIF